MLGLLGGKGEINKICPIITPVMGDEMLTDQGIEAWTNPTTTSDWQSYTTGASTVNQESTIINGGTYACRLDGDVDNSLLFIRKAHVVAAGVWHIGTAYMRGSATLKMGHLELCGIVGQNRNPGTTYTQYPIIARSTDTSATFVLARSSIASASLYYDTASLKPITFSSTLNYLGERSTKSGVYQCAPTISVVDTQSGIAICYFDVNNFVLAYTNGIKAYLDKCINGVWTNLINGTVTYAAERILKVEVNGENYDLYYNGTQVGSTAVISDAGLGRRVYGFSTYAGNTVGQVTTNPI